MKDIHELHAAQQKVYEVTVASEENLKTIRDSELVVKGSRDLRIQVAVTGNYDTFLRVLNHCDVTNISVVEQNLEDLFMTYYDRRAKG